MGNGNNLPGPVLDEMVPFVRLSGRLRRCHFQTGAHDHDAH